MPVSYFATVTVLFLAAVSLQAAVPDHLDKDLYEAQFRQAASQAETARRAANAKQAVLREKTSARTAAEIDRNEAQSIASEVQKLRERIAKNEATRTTLKTNLDRLVAEIKTAGQVRTTAAAASADASSDVVKLRDDILRLSDKSAQNAKALEAARQALASLRTQLIEVQAETDSLEADERRLSAEKEAYEDEHSGLRDRVAQLQDILRGLRDQCQQLEGELRAANKALADRQAELELLGQRIAEYDREIQRLGKQVDTANQAAEAAKKVTADVNTQIRTNTLQLQAIDIEKQKLEDTTALVGPEVTVTRAELDDVRTQIATVKSALKDAPDKEPLEARLKELETRQEELVAVLARQQEELKVAKDKLKEIPGKKAELKLKALDLEQRLKDASEAELQAIQKVGELSKAQKAQVQERTLAQKDCDQKQAQLPALQKSAEQAEKRHRDLLAKADRAGEQLEYLRNRRPYLDSIILASNAALRILKTEAIPNNTATLADLNRSQIEEQSKLNTATAEGKSLDLARKQKESALTEAERVASDKATALRQAEASLSALVADQSRDQQAYSGLEAENQSLASTIKVREADVAKKSGGLTIVAHLEVQSKRVDEALLLEKMAAETFAAFDRSAVTAQAAADKAKDEFGKRLIAYNSGKTAAEGKATADARTHGATTGADKGGIDGGPVGLEAGKKLGGTEGESFGKNAAFAKALAEAEPKALAEAVAQGLIETAEQKALRLADPTLASAFNIGEQRGKSEGEKDGLEVGDSKQAEDEGFKAGYAAGLNRVTNEFEISHRPLGRKAREAEILGSKPTEIKAMDPTAEPVAFETHGRRDWRAWFTMATAVAADRLGEISLDKIPRPSLLGLPYQDKYDHPDFVAAYRKVFDDEFLKSYLAAYQEAYRKVYVPEHSRGYAAAYEVAKNAQYPTELDLGAKKGAQTGLFEGLGYNGGKRAGYAAGKAKGEAVARERGRVAGDKEGYSANFDSAKASAIENGRKDVESDYNNNVKLRLLPETQKLSDADGDGKYQIGEKISLALSLRNFGGVRAEKGDVVLEVDPASVRGIQLASSTVRLAEIGAGVQADVTNLLVGTIQPASDFSLQGRVLHKGVQVGEVRVAEGIYAPFQIVFTDATDPKANLFVRSVGDGSGYQNAVWVRSLGDKALLNDLTISLDPEKGPIGISGAGGGAAKTFVPLTDPAAEGWKRKNFFLSAKSRVGLDTASIRVRLKNKAGQVILDKAFPTPVEVK